jgi:PAS domain S-box-containing protein
MDVEETKQPSELLNVQQAIEANVPAFLEAAPDAMVIVDQDGRILLINGQAERLFGYKRTELVGQPVEVLVPSRYRDNHPLHRAGYFAEPRPRPMGAGVDLYGVRKDGTEFPAEISLSSTRTVDGHRVYVAIRDVTERKRAEAALRMQQEHTQSIISTASDPFVSIDAHGMITDWNASAERVLGWARQEAIGRELADVVKDFDAWATKHLGGLNTALARKKLEPIQLLTREQWQAKDVATE